MSNGKNKNFERELPEGYEKAFYLNAKNALVGIVLNLVAVVVYTLVGVIAVCVFKNVINSEEKLDFQIWLGVVIGFVMTLAYVVLHELVHGAAYKILTGEKLTFGISWSCAFCGVPNIYVYRRGLLIACLAPFVLFSLLILLLIAACLIVAVSFSELLYLCTVIYVALSVVFAIHLGGCVGDVFMALLLTFKFRDPNTLARDTGPEQFIYVKAKKEENI